MSEHKGVLLGVAEVKVPLRHLPDEEKERLSHICYRRLLDIKLPPEEVEDEPVRCIGVVDSFYALQEVVLTVEEGVCRWWRKSEIVLQYGLRDVIMTLPAKDHPNRIIIMCKTENFGRTAAVLQMIDEECVRVLINKLTPILKKPPSRSNSQGGAFRRGAGSFGKAMSKRLNIFFSSLQNPQQENVPSTPPATPIAISEPVFSSVEPYEDDDDDDDDDDDSQSDSDDTADSESDRKLETVNYITHSRLVIAKPSLSPIEAELEFLIDSERKYLEALKAAFHDYHMITQSDFPMTKENCKSLFMYIEDLKKFHEIFLEEIISSRNNLSVLSDIFIKHSHNLKMYLNFIGNIPSTDRILTLHADYFKENFPTLTENLRKPRMRLNHYVLCLESLQKKVTIECKNDIQKAIDLLKECLKGADTRLVIGSVHNCKFSLLDHGNVVINSELSLKSGVGLQRRRYQVIVLQDLMLLAKGRQECCQYVASFQLNNVEIIHALRGLLIHLKIKRPGRSSFRMIFKARTIKFQQKWIDILKQHKDKLNSSLIAKELARSHELLSSLIISNKIKEDLNYTINKTTSSYEEKQAKRRSSVFYANLHMGDFANTPPLTILAGFSSLEGQMDNCIDSSDNLSNDQSLLYSEKRLVGRLKKAIGAFSRSEHLKGLLEQLYDMHDKYLYPATQTNINKCDVHILCHHLLTVAQNFTKLYTEILFLISVLAYELTMIEDEKNNLKIVFDNFLLLKKIINETQDSFHDSRSVFGEALLVIDDVIQSSNFLLKKKYIEDLPSDFSSTILKEGPLTIEPVQDEKKVIYAILTTNELSILHYKGTSCYILSQQIPLEKGKLGPPPGLKSFEIVVSSEDKKKIRYQFEALNVTEKNGWLAALERRIPSTSKQRKKSIISVTNLRREAISMKTMSISPLTTPTTTDICLESDL